MNEPRRGEVWMVDLGMAAKPEFPLSCKALASVTKVLL